MAEPFQASFQAIPHSIARIAEHLGARVIGDDSAVISAINSLEQAGEGEISFLADKKRRPQLENTRASAVLVDESQAEHCPVTAIVVDNPYAAYARTASLLYPRRTHIPGIHPSAVVDDNAVIDRSAWIGPGCVIEADAVIGANANIGPHCVIGRNARIGPDTTLIASVTVTHDCELGARGLIHPGTVIGSDGFGQAPDNGQWIKIPQLGRVIIGDDVEIGANCAIDRGSIGDTVIEDGVRMDNLIQIAHNIRIGAHTVIAAQTGIAGSTTIGKHCMFGGNVAISGHLEICDQVMLGGRAEVRQSIEQPGAYCSGTPLEPMKKWLKSSARFKQIDEMHKRISELEKKLAQLEAE